MSFETLLAFVLIEALLCLSPGPAVVLVIGLTVRYGCPMGFGAIAGILAANTFYFFLASIGVGAAIIASSAVFTAMKWIGAGYLVWLGVKMLTPVIWRAIVRVEPITPAKLSSSAPRSYETRSPEPKSGIRQPEFTHYTTLSFKCLGTTTFLSTMGSFRQERNRRRSSSKPVRNHDRSQ